MSAEVTAVELRGREEEFKNCIRKDRRVEEMLKGRRFRKFIFEDLQLNKKVKFHEVVIEIIREEVQKNKGSLNIDTMARINRRMNE